MYPKKVLFLNLKAFSFTGGIEKFNRAFLKALSDLEKEGSVVADAYSAYDDTTDTRYFASESYKGFRGKRVRFIIETLKAAANYDTIILGHINLAFVGWAIKRLYPAKEIVLITHGIEVWKKLSGVKDKMIRMADKVLTVSNFTRQKIIDIQQLDPAKVIVFHNTIDPHFTYPDTFLKPQYLLDRYHLTKKDPIIFTLTRLTFTEKYKGYDKVMEVLPQLKKRFPSVKYILAGKPDEMEKSRINSIRDENELNENLLLTGFVKDEEVVDHFLLADAFIMPSRKEGFGIVFIEAMACGLPVIAGNKDGSVDALQQGKLGKLVDPVDEAEILLALQATLDAKDQLPDTDARKLLQQKVIKAFGFSAYKERLKKVLLDS